MSKQGPSGLPENPKLYSDISERDYNEAMKYLRGNWNISKVCRHLCINERKLKTMMEVRNDHIPVKVF